MPDLVIFSAGLYRGGAQRVAIDIANAFSLKGKKIHLIVLGLEKGFEKELKKNIRIINFDCQRVLYSIPKLISYLKKTKPKIFFCTQPHCTVAAWISTKLANWKGNFIARENNSRKKVHGRKILIKDRIVWFLLNYIYKKINYVIAPSKGLAKEIPGNVQVVYNPINIKNILKQSKKNIEKNYFKKNKFILGVGRFIDQKRFSDLIRAFAKLQKKNLNLILLGEGELKSELVNLAESLKIKNKVFFPGFDNNPFKYMSKCEAFVLSSAWEGMPNVLIQALLCGSKIVSTDCPHGPKEILKNGYYGKLVSVGDVDSLSKAIKKCIGKKKNKKLRKKIEREFALKTQIKKLEKLFFTTKL